MQLLKHLAAMIGDAISRWIRTITPAVITYALAKWPWLDSIFGDIDPTAVTLFVFMAYYSLVAILETRVHPAFGWLLGKPKDESTTEFVTTTEGGITETEEFKVSDGLLLDGTYTGEVYSDEYSNVINPDL